MGVSPRVLLIIFFFFVGYAHPTDLTLQTTFNRQTSKHHQAKQGALNLQWTF
ncbi:putative autotransporter domain protein [Haemophilus influenzae]|nr:putative autotransporter domain protein [Haemophilus influenzae]